MSTNEWEDDNDEFEPDEVPGPKQLREQLKREKAERKRLEQTLQQVQRDLRQRTVKELLSSKGVNPKIAAFVPSDVEGEEAISQWLDEYADVFGVTPQPDPDVIDVGEANLRARDAAALQGSAPAPTADQMAAIQAASTREELARALAAAGLG